MRVRCPTCNTGYLLPDHLLGEQGARVRCPQCQGTFLVSRERGVEKEPPPSAAGGRAPTPPPSAKTAKSLAHEVLEELEERLGDRLVEARTRNRVLAELGPDLMQAFDEYRRRLGKDADPEPFRQALRERWALDLDPGSRL